MAMERREIPRIQEPPAAALLALVLGQDVDPVGPLRRPRGLEGATLVGEDDRRVASLRRRLARGTRRRRVSEVTRVG